MSDQFHLKMIKQAEADVQRDLLDALWYEVRAGRVIWFGRFNSGRLWRPGTDKGMYASIRYWFKGFVPGPGDHDGRTRGFPDIVGQLCDGRFFALECKAPGKRPTKLQREILDVMAAGNAVVAHVDSWQAGIEVIREAF